MRIARLIFVSWIVVFAASSTAFALDRKVNLQPGESTAFENDGESVVVSCSPGRGTANCLVRRDSFECTGYGGEYMVVVDGDLEGCYRTSIEAYRHITQLRIDGICR